MSRSILRSAVLMTVALALPATAQAQIHLGGLVRSAAKVMSVKYDTLVLELTPARLDAALKALEAEAQAGPQLSAGYQQLEAAYQQSLRDWQARAATRQSDATTYNQCIGTATGSSIGIGGSIGGGMGGGSAASPGSGSMTVSGAGPTFSANLNDPAVRARINSLKDRLQAAGKANDMALSMALADSLRQAMGMNMGTQTVTYSGTPGAPSAPSAGMSAGAHLSLPQAQQKCGYANYQASTQAATTDVQPQPPASPRDSLTKLASAAGGFTPGQYAMMRERILGFLSITVGQVGHGTTGYAFNPPEIVALQSRRADLTKYQMMLQTQ
ncbi:MAG: hypothetical protein ACHQXA_10330 [Gemmatimonadales bacterium]